MKKILVKAAVIVWIACQSILVVVGAYSVLYSESGGVFEQRSNLLDSLRALPLLFLIPAFVVSWLGYDGIVRFLLSKEPRKKLKLLRTRDPE